MIMGRATMKLEYAGFNELVAKYEGLGGDVKKLVTKELEKIGRKVGEDTSEAIRDSHLPAHGRFHSKARETEKAVVKNPKADNLGQYIISVGVGFDFEAEGAGGYLIKGYYQNYHGTPRHMDYDKRLNDMYVKRKYMREIETEMQADVAREIKKLMEK